VTIVRNTETSDRELIVQGLRELADFLTANPDVPITGTHHRLQYSVDSTLRREGSTSYTERRAEVERVAALLGVEPVEPDSINRHYVAERRFGALAYLVASVDPGPKPGLCELCKTRPVHLADSDHPRRITARVCTPCLGDGPWSSDQDEEATR